MTRSQRFQALLEVVEELSGLYGELTEISKAKRSAYHSAFLASTESSYTARDGWARANAHDLDQDELELKGKIQVLELQRDTLKFIIEHNMEDT